MADYFEHKRKLDMQREAEAAGLVADSMEVRLALMAKLHAGEMTLEEVQAELKRIQRGAKKAGKITRAQAYRGATTPTGAGRAGE
jgi:hypothetical protein